MRFMSALAGADGCCNRRRRRRRLRGSWAAMIGGIPSESETRRIIGLFVLLLVSVRVCVRINAY